jgi:RND family efflux transporter MFP subunit
MSHLRLTALALSLAACSEPERTEITPAEDREITAPPTAVATSVEVPDVMLLNGTLLPDEESQLAPLVPGRVVEVMVERGQRVEEGQPLVRLRDTDFRLQQQAARAQVDQAQARLGVDDNGQLPPPDQTAEVRTALANMELADEQLRRAEELAQRGVYSQAQLDEARARAQTSREQHRLALQNVRGAAASLASARAQLRQASTAVSDSIVRAPFAGEIASRNVSIGEYVGPQAQLVTLVRVNPLRLELEVPEERVLDVRPAQAVEVRLDAVPDRPFAGSVRYVSAAVGRQTRSLTVEAIVANDDGVLRPGMFAQARIDLGRMRELVSIPNAAVSTNAGVHRAFVIADGVIEERVLTIAEAREDGTFVESGLRAGETVAIDGLEDLYDGARIAPAR